MKTQRKTNKSILVKTIIILMAVLFTLSAFAPMKASAHNAYFLTITLNESEARYEPIVLFDKAGWVDFHHSHREADVGYFGVYKYSTLALPAMKASAPKAGEVGKITPKQVEKAISKTHIDGINNDYMKVDGKGNPHFIYSFPGYHGTKDYDATAVDLARAEWVSRTMIQSLNDAIGFVTHTAKKSPDKYDLMFLGTNLANGGYKTHDFSYNGYKVNVTAPVNLDALAKKTGDKSLLKNKVVGVNKDGYAKVKISKKGMEPVERYFVSKVPKGYKKNQPLFDSLPSNLQSLHDAKKEKHGFSQDVVSLTWKHAVLQAHVNYAKDTTFDNFAAIGKPNKVEQYFTEMGENFLLGLRTMLGLYSFSELMLNEGARGGDSYFLGIMPTSWLDSASILHWTSMALSWLLIMFAFVRVLALRNLAAINIAKRVDLVDGIQSLIIVGFALMLFNPIFYTLANMNFLLVDVMKNTSNVTSEFGSAAPGAGMLAKLFISLAYLVVEVYFNFIYISRAIIVSILYGVGPLFVASLAFGGKYSQIFSNYMKELVGTIYMQTFHAILVAFFASVTVFGGIRLFEQLVVLFAFIPLTKFFREAIGVGGGIADMAGGGAFGAVGDMAKMGSKSMKQSGGKMAGASKKSMSTKKSNSSAPMTQMKSSSNFQSGSGSAGAGGAGGAGGGSGSMKQVDNSTVASGGAGKSSPSPKTTSEPIKSTGANASAQSTSSRSAQSSSKGGTMANNDRAANLKSDRKLVKSGASAGAGFAGVAGAVGMSAVGQGTVSQNTQTGKSSGSKKNFDPRRNDMRDPQNMPTRGPEDLDGDGIRDSEEGQS